MKSYSLSSARMATMLFAAALVFNLFSPAPCLAAWSKKIKLEAKVVSDRTCPELEIALVGTKDGHRYCAFGGAYNPWLSNHLRSVIRLKGKATSKDDPRNANIYIAFDYIDVTDIDHAKVYKGPSAFWETVAAFAGVPPITSVASSDDSSDNGTSTTDTASATENQGAPENNTAQSYVPAQNWSSQSSAPRYTQPALQCIQLMRDNNTFAHDIRNTCNVAITVIGSTPAGMWGSPGRVEPGQWTPVAPINNQPYKVVACVSPAIPTDSATGKWANYYTRNFTCPVQ
jgi:hypothetical protein